MYFMKNMDSLMANKNFLPLDLEAPWMAIPLFECSTFKFGWIFVIIPWANNDILSAMVRGAFGWKPDWGHISYKNGRNWVI